MGLNTDNGEIEKDRLNRLSLIFNVMHVDYGRDFTIFEGPIDSFFIDNSISLTGVKKEPFDFDELPTARYFLDNDNAGKRKMCEKIEKGKSVFLWSKFIEDYKLTNRKKIKDLNDLVILAYKEKLPILKNIKSYFSSDPLDMLFI